MIIKNISRKKKRLTQLSWILSNIVLTMVLWPLFLSGFILLYEHIDSNWIVYLIFFPCFGILQGLVMSIFQSPTLWFCNLPLRKIFKLSLANICGATIVMILLSFGLGSFIIDDNLDGSIRILILLLMWHISLFTAGFCWGLVTGDDREQKIDWAVATGFAYPLWYFGHLISGMSYFSALKKFNPIALFGILGFATLLAIFGFCLTIPIINYLQHKYQKS